MSILFAATYPERTAALVVRSAFPRRMWAPRLSLGPNRGGVPARGRARAAASSARASEALEAVRALGRFERRRGRDASSTSSATASSPGALEALHRMNREIDIRHVLPAVRVPTLVLHGADDTIVPLEVARYIAARIPRRAIRRDPGRRAPRLRAGRERMHRDEIETLPHGGVGVGRLGGGRAGPRPRDRPLHRHRRLDREGAPSSATAAGASCSSATTRSIRRELVRFRGRELDTAGDGFFAAFDGPARAIRCASRDRRRGARAGHRGPGGPAHGRVRARWTARWPGSPCQIGARVAAQAGPGEVLVSSTVKDLVAGSGIDFEERGAAELKGVPGEWRLYAVADS